MCRTVMLILIGTLLGVALMSCGKSREVRGAGELFPVEVSSTGWKRGPEIGRYVGDSLFLYIDGAAELYHKYDFVEVHVAKYQKGESEIIAEIYRFTDADRAFGMYTTLRPNEPDTLLLGVQGFHTPTNAVFTKGAYLVNVVGYDEYESEVSPVKVIATAIGNRLPGTTSIPALFALFPENGRIANTEKIFTDSFLGQAFLTDIYTVDYSLDGQLFISFLADDESGEKFRQWLESSNGTVSAAQELENLPFDDGKVLLSSSGYYGEIAAGLKAGRMLGIVGYRQEHRAFLADWLASLPG